MSEKRWTCDLPSPTDVLLFDVSMVSNRQLVASTYAWALQHWMEQTDWPKVNAAIIERWSESGLRFIKRLAWKEAQRRARPTPEEET